MSLKYHYNLIYNDLKDSVESFSWNSQHTKMAIKTALSCVTAIFLANLFKLNMPFWSGITTLVMMRANVGASFSKGWMRTGGCTIGCILCLFFLGYTVQNPLLFSVFLFCGIFLSFYLGVRVKYGYFWMYMLANMTLIGMVSISNPYNTFPLHILFYRSAEIFLGVIVSWLYNIILWPNYAGNQFEDSLNNIVSKAVGFQRDLINHYCLGKSDIKEVKKKYSQIMGHLRKCKSVLADMDTENFLLRKEEADYKAILNIIEIRIVSLGNIINHFSSYGVSPLPKHFMAFFKKLNLTIGKLSKIECFKEKRFRKNIPNNQIFDIELKKYYDPEASKKYSVSEVMFLYEFIHHLEAFFKDLERISSSDLNNADSNKTQIINDNSDYINFNFFSIKVLLYKPALKNAVKGGLAVVFTFWFCMWLQIPGGMLNMSVAIIAVFGPQLDTLASKHKGLLRMIGCLFGAAVGLFILLCNIESAIIFFMMIFIFSFFSAYIFGGRPGVAYIGLQGGIAFLLCVAGGFSQVTSIDAVIERLVGITIAIAFMWIINYIIWPENLIMHLKTKLSNLNSDFFRQMDILKLKLSDVAFDVEDVSAIIVDVDVNDVNSILNILKIQQDLPIETIGNIKMSSMYISKISKKLYSVSQTSKEVVDFIITENLDLLHVYIKSMTDVKFNIEEERIELLETLTGLVEQLDNFTQNIRTKGILVNREFSFKRELSCLILNIKRILYDSIQLAKIEGEYGFEK